MGKLGLREVNNIQQEIVQGHIKKVVQMSEQSQRTTEPERSHARFIVWPPLVVSNRGGEIGVVRSVSKLLASSG